MDSFDYIDPVANRKKFFAFIWNFLTLMVLLLTICLVGAFIMIFINPNASINPFPPPTLPAMIAMPSLTPTAMAVLPSTWTPTVTITPTPTQPPPTLTPIPSDTPIAVFTPTNTPTTTVSLASPPFELSVGSPIAIASLTFHPEAGCNWMGVAGQVFDMSGAPISTGVIVQLGGVLDGENKEITTLTGTANQYGEAGYEIVLASKPVASSSSMWVQLLDQAGLAMSPKVYFDTYDTCDKNLIFINFHQVQ